MLPQVPLGMLMYSKMLIYFSAKPLSCIIGVNERWCTPWQWDGNLFLECHTVSWGKWIPAYSYWEIALHCFWLDSSGSNHCNLFIRIIWSKFESPFDVSGEGLMWHKMVRSSLTWTGNLIGWAVTDPRDWQLDVVAVKSLLIMEQLDIMNIWEINQRKKKSCLFLCLFLSLVIPGDLFVFLHNDQSYQMTCFLLTDIRLFRS